MTDNEIKWHTRFIQVARLVSTWSKDPSTQVGAALIKNRRILSTGYNGFPPGILDDDRLNDRPVKYKHVIHAELNCLLQPNIETTDSTLYLFSSRLPGPPCSNCMKHIITAGVKQVVYIDGTLAEDWQEDQILSENMAVEAGLELVKLRVKE